MALRSSLEELGQDVLVVHVRGVIDLASISEWEDLIHRVIQCRKNAVIVDVGLVGHISARGLEMMLALAANQSLIDGCLVVAGAHGGIRRAAKMVGLWDMAIEANSLHIAMENVGVLHAEKSSQTDAQSPGRYMSQQAGG